MTSVFVADHQQQLSNSLSLLSFQDQDQVEVQSKVEIHEKPCGNHGGVCAICLDKIVLQETALVKGCEHAYCVMCILRWASYNEKPTCPQCKHPFDFLNVHRSLDGSIQDYMFEESVCLLLRAVWFNPLIVEHHHNDVDDDVEAYYPYGYYDDDDEEDDLDEYLSHSSSLRIGNRRWGDNGYVRSGRQEARPIQRTNNPDSGAGSSREPKKKEPVNDRTGRRAKRTLKREAADKAAAVKHQQHLARLGRK
ncbi:RING/U-box superfamily protein [Euphorbia peplus]|nr:RING/U-box superfamily protein [Euphorbia peplus]